MTAGQYLKDGNCWLHNDQFLFINNTNDSSLNKGNKKMTYFNKFIRTNYNKNLSQLESLLPKKFKSCW